MDETPIEGAHVFRMSERLRMRLALALVRAAHRLAPQLNIVRLDATRTSKTTITTPGGTYHIDVLA